MTILPVQATSMVAPSAPALVAWYPRFGHPGFAGHNSIFAAHINYIGYGNGPFAHLTSAAAGDALYVTMANGDIYTYTVRSVEVVDLAVLDMDAVVFPFLGTAIERITLISCGGTFVPNPSTTNASTLTVAVAASVVPGVYSLTIQGTATPGVRTAPLAEAAPAAAPAIPAASPCPAVTGIRSGAAGPR